MKGRENMKKETRSIKFRAWDKAGNQMIRNINGFQSSNIGNQIIVLYQDDGMLSHNYIRAEYPNHFILMQFTGLHDKNGVEIFEGDIIRATRIDDYFSSDKPEEIITAITIKITTEVSDYSMGGPDGDSKFRDVEVIGTIYENPDLLSEKEG